MGNREYIGHLSKVFFILVNKRNSGWTGDELLHKYLDVYPYLGIAPDLYGGIYGRTVTDVKYIVRQLFQYRPTNERTTT